MYSPQPYPSGSIPISSSFALATSNSSSDGSNSICHAIGISRPLSSVTDMSVKRMGDHRSSSQEPSPSSSAFARFFGNFHFGILGMAFSMLPVGLPPQTNRQSFGQHTFPDLHVTDAAVKFAAHGDRSAFF